MFNVPIFMNVIQISLMMIKKVIIGLYDKETGEQLAHLQRELPSDRVKAVTYDDSPLAMLMKRYVECAIRGAVNENKKLELIMDLEEPEFRYVAGKLPF